MLNSKQEIVPLTARKGKTLFYSRIKLTKSSGYHQLRLANGHFYCPGHNFGKASCWQSTSPATLVRQA